MTDVIVQTLTDQGIVTACTTGSPAAAVAEMATRISVISNDNHAAALLASRIRIELGLAVRCGGGPWDLRSCQAHGRATTRQVLVVLATDPACATSVQPAAARFLAQPGSVAVGVVGWYLDPATDLPAAVRPFQAVRFRNDPGEAIDEILAGAQLEPDDDRRAFISYAHLDTAVALDLMEQLSAQRFQVFLDSHRIPPASLWDLVLKDAIVDAAMVVVLETPDSVGSTWVGHEVAFAAASACGLVAVHPSPGSGPVVALIGEGLRVRTTDMAAAARFVTHQHRLQLAYRRESMVHAVERELSCRGLTATRTGWRVETANTSTTAHPRPVTVRQLRRLTESAAKRTALVLSPAPVLRAKQADRRWLRITGPEVYPEGSLTDLGSRIRTLG